MLKIQKTKKIRFEGSSFIFVTYKWNESFFHFVDDGSSTSCLIGLKEFIDDNNDSIGMFVSEEFLKI